MARVHQLVVLALALASVAEATNVTNASTATTTLSTTLTTFTTTTTYTPTSTTASTATATATVTATSTTATDMNVTNTSSAATTTTEAPSTSTGVATQEIISGSFTVSLVGDCAAFCSDDKVKMALRRTVASVSNVHRSRVSVTIINNCNTRRLSSLRSGRRLDGSIVVEYTITLAPGSPITGSVVVGAIASTSYGSWSSTLSSKLQLEGLSTYSAQISGVSIPVLEVVTVTTTVMAMSTTTENATSTTTMPSTTTTAEALATGLDSSALTRMAFTSAHVWSLTLLFVVTRF